MVVIVGPDLLWESSGDQNKQARNRCQKTDLVFHTLSFVSPPCHIPTGTPWEKVNPKNAPERSRFSVCGRGGGDTHVSYFRMLAAALASINSSGE